MIDFSLKDNIFQLIVDLSVFNESVLSKVIYYLSAEYIVYQQNIKGNIQSITLEKKNGTPLTNELQALKEKINQLLIDYKNRDIIYRETKNIRDILYIKAFANNENFEDYNLIG